MNLGGLTDRARMAAGQRFSHSIRTRLALDEVGNWALDRADGTITHDFSGWDNHGTIHLGTGGNTNLAAAFVPGVHGQAMSFDGVDDRVTIRDVDWFDGRRPWTIEFWMSSGPFRGGWGRIVSDEDIAPGGGEPLLIFRDIHLNFIALSLRLEGGINFGMHVASNFTPNQWEHMVWTYDGTRLCGFRNGVLVGTCPSSTLIPGTNPRNLTLGNMPGGEGPWDGTLDEVRIFRAAVPTSYIQKRYVYGIKSLAANGGITEEEKETRIAELRNSGQLAIDLDSALAGNIDFSPYQRYLQSLALEVTE